MKKIIVSTPVNRCIGKNRADLKKNGIFIIFCLILFCGVLCGALSGRSADSSVMKRLDVIFLTNFDMRCSRGLLSCFAASFGSTVIFLFVIFLLGLSLWGGFLAVLVPFFKGYGYGLSTGFLYSEYGLKGIFYNILIIMPGMFISSAVIAAASLYSFRNSFKSLQCFRRQVVSDDPRAQIKSYLLKMLRLLFLSAAASLLDMMCSLCFSWIFHF